MWLLSARCQAVYLPADSRPKGISYQKTHKSDGTKQRLAQLGSNSASFISIFFLHFQLNKRWDKLTHSLVCLGAL